MTEFEKELVRFVSGYLDAGVSSEDYVKAFSQRLLDSIGQKSKPKVSEDLEEEMNRYFNDMYSDVTNCERANDSPNEDIYREVARHFAQWQKEQMMKEAVEGQVCGDNAKAWISDNPSTIFKDIKDGDRVKLIILPKED